MGLPQQRKNPRPKIVSILHKIIAKLGCSLGRGQVNSLLEFIARSPDEDVTLLEKASLIHHRSLRGIANFLAL